MANDRSRLVRSLTRRDGAFCTWCSRPLLGDATLDHVVPVYSNGANSLANLVLACHHCNHSRNDYPAELWRIWCATRGFDVRHEIVDAAVERAREAQRVGGWPDEQLTLFEVEREEICAA